MILVLFYCVSIFKIWDKKISCSWIIDWDWSFYFLIHGELGDHNKSMFVWKYVLLLTLFETKRQRKIEQTLLVTILAIAFKDSIRALLCHTDYQFPHRNVQAFLFRWNAYTMNKHVLCITMHSSFTIEPFRKLLWQN